MRVYEFDFPVPGYEPRTGYCKHGRPHVMNTRTAPRKGNFATNWKTVSFSSRIPVQGISSAYFVNYSIIHLLSDSKSRAVEDTSEISASQSVQYEAERLLETARRPTRHVLWKRFVSSLLTWQSVQHAHGKHSVEEQNRLRMMHWQRRVQSGRALC